MASASDVAERPPLFLASSSPRRLDLLAQIGIVPDGVLHPAADEAVRPNETPRHYVTRIADAKLAAAAPSAPPAAIVLAADTAVALGRRILPKAEDAEAARRCLGMLSGRRHTVLTAIALRWPDAVVVRRVVESTVTFARLTPRQVDALIEAGDWHGKAGGYAVQGRAASLVRFVSGSYSAVVGLPLFETAQLLRGRGWLP